MIGAYLVDPARRTYVLEELAADAGIAVRAGAEAEPAADDAQLSLGEEPEAVATRPSRRGSRGSSPSASATSSTEFGLERIMREVELPLVEVLVAMEREGLKLDTERLAAIGEGMEAGSTSSRRRSTRQPAASSRSARPRSSARCSSLSWA